MKMCTYNVGKPRSDSGAQSARTRPQPSSASSSVNANKLNTAVGSMFKIFNNLPQL